MMSLDEYIIVNSQPTKLRAMQESSSYTNVRTGMHMQAQKHTHIKSSEQQKGLKSQRGTLFLTCWQASFIFFFNSKWVLLSSKCVDKQSNTALTSKLWRQYNRFSKLNSQYLQFFSLLCIHCKLLLQLLNFYWIVSLLPLSVAREKIIFKHKST